MSQTLHFLFAPFFLPPLAITPAPNIPRQPMPRFHRLPANQVVPGHFPWVAFAISSYCTPVPHQDGLYSSPCRVPRCLISHIHSTLERFQESLRATLALGQLLALKASCLFCRLHSESSRHICSHHLVRPRRLVGQSQLCFRSDLDRQSGFVLGFFPHICINITIDGWFVPQWESM